MNKLDRSGFAALASILGLDGFAEHEWKSPQNLGKPVTGNSASTIHLSPDISRARVNTMKFAMNKGTPSYLLSSYLASRIPTLAESLVKTRFWWIGEKMHPRLMIYDSVTNLLWNANPDRSTATAAEAKKSIATIKLVEISGWRLPVKEEISSFAKATENPLQRGSLYSLCEEFYWLCEAGRIDLQKGYFGVARDDIGRVICCNSLFAKSLHQELIFSALEKDWELRPCGKDEADDLLAPISLNP